MCYQWKLERDWTRCDIKGFQSLGSAFLLDMDCRSLTWSLIHETIIKFSKGKAEKALKKLVQETCNKAYIKKCKTGLYRLLHFNSSRIRSHLTILPCLLEDYNLHLYHFQNSNTKVLRAKRTLFCFCTRPCSESKLGQRLTESQLRDKALSPQL